MQETVSYQEVLEKEIASLSLPLEPKNLYEPLRYFLSLGGKRTRPTLTLMACELFGKPFENALNAALAIELFHNFTLLHDDIMDDAPLRRGKQTVHEKWNTNVGILSGDVLFVEAYKQLSNHDVAILPKLLNVFSRTAVEVCEGQQLDMDFEQRNDVKIEEYIEMIRLKTSVLLGAALEMGGIVAEASESDLNAIYQFGVNIGIAFQLKDDLLDVYANPDKFGKQIAGDIISNKKTYLLLKALALANDSQKKSLEQLLLEKNPTIKVKKVVDFYNELKVPQHAEQKMLSYYDTAIAHLKQIQVPESAKAPLYEMAKYIMDRDV